MLFSFFFFVHVREKELVADNNVNGGDSWYLARHLLCSNVSPWCGSPFVLIKRWLLFLRVLITFSCHRDLCWMVDSSIGIRVKCAQAAFFSYRIFEAFFVNLRCILRKCSLLSRRRIKRKKRNCTKWKRLSDKFSHYARIERFRRNWFSHIHYLMYFINPWHNW